MKSKLIACLLGLTIILSSGTAVLAEGEDPAAAPAVQEPAQPAQSEPTEPVVTPVDPPAEPADPVVVDPGTSGESGGNTNSGSAGTGTESGSGDTAASGDNTDPGTNTDNGGSVVEDTGSSTPAAEPAESETSVSPDVKETSEEKTEEEDKDKEEEKPEEEVIVTGFSGIADIVVKKKPSLKDAMTLLPTVVEANLSDGNKIYVPVDWGCASDYNDEKAERFTFGSSLKKNPDGSTYNIGHPIAPGVRFPTVSIVIKNTDDKKKEEDKDTRKESKDPVEEDAPLVMDDVTAANISPDEGEEQVFIYLMKELGLNQAAACGVLANIHYESGFNSHAIGDGGTSYGICQWHAGRYLSLVSFCDKIKVPYGSVEGQLKYMEQEITNGYAHVLEYLKKIPNTEVGAFDAAYYWCYHFERPAMILRQSTLRGNAAKNSYWPRYKDADPDKLEKKSQESASAAQKISVMEDKLDGETAEKSTESTVSETKETPVAPVYVVKETPAAEAKTTPAVTAAPVSETKEAGVSEKQGAETEYKALEAVDIQTVGEYRSAVIEQKTAWKKAELEDRISIIIPDDDEDSIAENNQEKSDIEIFTSFQDEPETESADSANAQKTIFVY